MKTCTRCKIEQDEENFYLINRSGKRNPTRYRHCKACCAAVAKENRSYTRNWELSKKYGISLDEYNEQVSSRKSHCDICNEKVKTLHVDHNHTTGRVRGYLCGSCNRGIGLLKDNSSICRGAAGYLEKYGD